MSTDPVSTDGSSGSTDGSSGAAQASTLFSHVAGDISDTSIPVVVLCHGSMDRSAGMLRLSRQLDLQAAVIRYDRRGYARSSRLGPPFTLEAHIDDLEAVLDQHAPGRRIALGFGHSFGGNVVLGLAARRPELFDEVAVYETPLSWLDWWPGTTAGGAAVRADDAHAAAEGFMRRLIGDERWERLPEATRRRRLAEGPAMVAELVDLRREQPWDERAVACPVQAIAGAYARPHHRRGMQLLAEMVDHGEFRQLDGAGHAAPNTHPEALAEMLKQALNRRAD